MLSFTVPTQRADIKSRKHSEVKNGRYTKLRYLLKLRAFIAKEINNSKEDIKYFINIELGEKYSNPHLHIQVWVNKSITSARTINLIYQKAISKFNLNYDRCKLSIPDKDIDIYHYVIKDYSKNLSDEDVWNLEVQKKRMRKQLSKQIRFYSKSQDKYGKKLYRVVYSWGVLRENANCVIEFFKDNFFKFTKRDLKFISFFCVDLSKLFIYRTRRSDVFFGYVFSFVFYVLYACRSPPIY